MKIKHVITRVLVCLLSISMLVQPFAQTAYAAARPAYLKSATYFGDAWPINYWNSEDANMASNLAKIRADGFNSIILVIPWREFQPSDEHGEFNETAFSRLHEVMTCAEEQGLGVMLRVGYCWDYHGRAELPARYTGILQNGSTDRNMWIGYCRRLYESASAHGNFWGGFMTWEDFWEHLDILDSSADRETRTRLAAGGYQAYLRDHYTLDQVSGMYGESFGDFSQVYVPYRKQRAAELYFAYYDQVLNEILAQSQAVFPGLSMEIRADGDKIYVNDQDFYYYSHQNTYGCGSADYAALMYSVSMGQSNEYNEIPAHVALASTDKVLRELSAASGKKLYVEQLLYEDSTAEFAHNTKIAAGDVDDYIQWLGSILPKSTMGYGLWVYRNYVNNCVYNGQFELGKQGWTFLDRATVVETDGKKMARIGGMSSKLYQDITGRLVGHPEVTVELYVRPLGRPAEVSVRLGNETRTVSVSEAGTYRLSFPWRDWYDLMISSDVNVLVDDIEIYTYEQYGRIHDRDGNEQDLADDFRVLNSRLP